MLRILIADDHEIVRRGVRNILSAHPGWEVCGEAADGREASEIGLREKPDIAILDVSMPGLNGIGVARQLRQALPKLEVLFFTMHDDEETMIAGLGVGARGYLQKSDTDQHLVAAVAALGAHRPYFSAAASELLLSGALHDRKRSALESFTGRELEVAQLIAEGNSNKQIARRLGITVKTVETHRGAAMRKAGVRTAAEFVRFAIRRNLITP
jgi:DNA-binding NarL/FixJ family response regulator